MGRETRPRTRKASDGDPLDAAGRQQLSPARSGQAKWENRGELAPAEGGMCARKERLRAIIVK
jgi:hypothetical protein